MKVPNDVTYDKIADGCDGMAGKLTDTERDKADEAEEREVIVFLWFIDYIKSLCWEVRRWKR